MKVTLKIVSDGSFTISLFPETKAETDILRYAAEKKDLTCHFSEPYGNEKALLIYPIEKQP